MRSCRFVPKLILSIPGLRLVRSEQKRDRQGKEVEGRSQKNINDPDATIIKLSEQIIGDYNGRSDWSK